MNPFRNHHDFSARRTYRAWWKKPMIAGVLVSSVGWLCFPIAARAMPDAPSNSVATTNDQPAGGATQGNGPAIVAAPAQNLPHFYIQEYRVVGGAHLLPRVEVEAAVYPFLGPYRSAEDVEQARAALEQAYRQKGYQTVSVQIPQQNAKSGIITLQVMRGEVARLRVHGSRYFSIDQIKREAPSLQEGQSPNFSQVTYDLGVLNDVADRRVTPSLRPGTTPGSVDVDLNVQDTLPLHGSLELNNRYSADTDQLRVNGSVSYDNLWQLEHSIGFSFQLSPEDTNQVQVFSGYYLARIPDVSWISFMLQGTDQDSNVNTLGGIGVAGKGQTIGGRAIFTLPAQTDFYHSLSLGIDYKHNTQLESEGSTSLGVQGEPITYYPFSAAYSGSWIGKGYETDMDSSVNLAIRGMGDGEERFENNRHGANGDFIYYRGDLSHTRDLPEGFQFFVKAQGQASSEPLINNEQFSGGGLGTVRGYLESEELGDNAILGSTEIRTPSLGQFLGKEVDEWRFYLFGEGGELTIDDPLPEQQSVFRLASVGGGTRIKLVSHLNGSFDIGLPLDNGPDTNAYEALLTFRLWAEF